MAGEIADEANSCIRAFSEHLNWEIIELNALLDYIHPLMEREIRSPQALEAWYEARVMIRIIRGAR